MRMKTGRKFRDCLGRVWTVESDGLLTLEDSAEEAWMFSAVEDRYGPVEEIPDPVNRPQHYLFPGGHEVINISEWLTSNAGQAVQYLARACRTDGNVKGNQLEDVRKALVFVEREISRIQSQSAHDLLR